MPKPINLLQTPLKDSAHEQFNLLLQRSDIRLEQIVSPPNFRSQYFNQADDEWVTLLQGSATLSVGSEIIELDAGDCLFIPAHTPHRIETTSESPHCIWLALHLPSNMAEEDQIIETSE